MDRQSLALVASEVLTIVAPNYRPPVGVNGFNPYNQVLSGMPAFSMSAVDVMRHDYQVKLAMSMKVVPVMKPQFAMAGDPEVLEFVQDTLKAIWTQNITDILEAMWYTRFGCEMVYKRGDDGFVRYERMIPFHPRDFKIWTTNGEICGLRVVNSHSQASDVVSFGGAVTDGNGLDTGISAGDNINNSNLGSKIYGFCPKMFCYVHQKKFGGFEGQSELEGAYEPWMEKVREGGAISSRSLWYYKCAFESGVMFYPDGVYVDPANPQAQIPNRDLALKALESIRNGANIAIPQVFDASGNPLWSWQPGAVHQGGETLLQYIDHLDGKVNKGTGIPDDVIEQVSGTGSYAGRTIPFIAFLEAGTPTVRDVSRELARQTLVPLAQINFGESRGKDWEITEAKVNTDQFLGGDEANGDETGIPGDGDNDGIPQEQQLAQQQSQLDAIDRQQNGANPAQPMQPRQFSMMSGEERVKAASEGKRAVSKWTGVDVKFSGGTRRKVYGKGFGSGLTGIGANS